MNKRRTKCTHCMAHFFSTHTYMYVDLPSHMHISIYMVAQLHASIVKSCPVSPLGSGSSKAAHALHGGSQNDKLKGSLACTVVPILQLQDTIFFSPYVSKLVSKKLNESFSFSAQNSIIICYIICITCKIWYTGRSFAGYTCTALAVDIAYTA